MSNTLLFWQVRIATCTACGLVTIHGTMRMRVELLTGDSMLKMMTKGNLFKLFAVAMAACMLFVTAISAYDKKDNNVSEGKISAELLRVMAEKSNDDLIPIELWLKGIDDNIIKSAMRTEKGMDTTIYEDPTRIENEIFAELAKQLEKQVGYEIAHDKDADGMSLIDWAINDKVDEYLMAWREIITREYSTLNDRFVASNIGEKQREIIYNSRSTPCLIVEATKVEIVAYANQEIVNDISLYVELIQEPDLNISLTQIGADGTTGTKSSLFNSGAGYKGSGVTIGILEAGGAYDWDAEQLKDINGTRLKLLDANGNQVLTKPTPDDHATFVTSLIIGQSKTYSSVTYEGVVPLATAYQMITGSDVAVRNGIDILSNKSCKVINYSAGATNSGGGYTGFDRDVDEKIKNLKIVFVKSAGNNAGGYGANDNTITSPGKALNVITVGNADTKSNATTARTAPYNINSSSSFIEANFLPNKPDIVAPGSNISYLRRSNQVATSSGTSYAAPLVAGVVAQLIQAKPALMSFGSPSAILKARLLLGAEANKIALTHDNPIAGLHLRDKSGAGLVNAAKAVYDNPNSYVMYAGYPGITSAETLSTGYVYAGQTIDVVMVYERNNTGTTSIPVMITQQSHLDDIDIYLKNSSGAVVAASTSATNNVEIIRYTATSSGYYSVVIDPIRIVNSSAKPYVAVVFMVGGW